MRCSTVFVVSGMIWKLDVTFNDLNDLFNQIQQSLWLKDPSGLEHCKSKLERCIPIVSSILLCISNECIFNGILCIFNGSHTFIQQHRMKINNQKARR